MSRRYIIGFSVFVVLIIVMTLIGRGSANPPVGALCTVQFRRDALGAAGVQPIPPTDEAAVSMTGTLKGVHQKWLVLAQGPEETWIARDTVLLIRIIRK